MAAPGVNFEPIIEHIFSLIDFGIAIRDKINSIMIKNPTYDKGIVLQVATARIIGQIGNAKAFLRALLGNYLYDATTGSYRLACGDAAGHLHVFTPANISFNRIVLVDVENVRLGLARPAENESNNLIHLGLNEHNSMQYLRNLVAADDKALYIFVRAGTPPHGVNPPIFSIVSNNLIECNVLFPEMPDNQLRIRFNETDDFVMLALLTFLTNELQNIFPGTQIPVFVMSADNYDWFTPKNYAGGARIEGENYPYVVYYAPLTGGQWCHFRSGNRNNRIGHRLTKRHNAQGRYNNNARGSLNNLNYYNSRAFPTREQLTEFESRRETSHPMLGHTCSLRRQAGTFGIAPHKYKRQRGSPNIYTYTTREGVNCTYNIETNQYEPDRHECKTWTKDTLESFVGGVDMSNLQQTKAVIADIARQEQEEDMLAEQARLAEEARLEEEAEARRAAEAEEARKAEEAMLINNVENAYSEATKIYNKIEDDYKLYSNKLETHAENPTKIVEHSIGFRKSTDNNKIRIDRLLDTITDIKVRLDPYIDADKKMEIDAYIQDIGEMIDIAQNYIDKADKNKAEMSAFKRKINNNKTRRNNGSGPAKKTAKNNKKNTHHATQNNQ
jgi:hypothetical protein